MVSQGVLECPGGWENTCGCLRDHNYCWPRPDTRCCDRLLITDETPPDEAALIERMLRMSVEILHGMSGRQFGLCRRTIRPCRDECGRGMARPAWGWAANGGILEPYLDSGQWFNNPCGKCFTDCSCSSVCEVSLPALVQSIVEVRLDGVVLDPSTYRVDNRRKLVRLATTIVAAPEVLTDVHMNWAEADTTACFPVDPILIENMAIVPGPTPPFCYQSPPLTGGQHAVMTGDCPTMSIDVAGNDAGTPIAFTSGAGFGPFHFPAATNVTAGGQAVSGWTNDVRMVIKYLSGPGVVVDENGQMPLPGGTSVFQICFERRTFGGDVACWPTCQEMGLPATEPGTFEVTYLRGKPVPEYGLWAAGLLACELIKACAPPGDNCACRLPDNVQSVVREGVSIDLDVFRLGGTGDPEFGRTGIPEVDLWLSTVNPNRATSRARAYSPDRRPPRRTTWPCADD